MSIQWTLVATFLYAEIATVLLFVLPFISAKRWQKFFKSRFLQVLSGQASWYFGLILFILTLFLLDAIREMRKYSHKEVGEHSHLESELQISMRLFRAQRNFYISGFSLFLSLVIKRFVDLLSKQALLIADNEAVLKQAKSASEANKALLNMGSGEAVRKNLNEEQHESVEKLKEEIETLKKLLETANKDKQAVISQSKALENEYDRLSEECRKLQLEKNTEDESSKKSD